MTADIRTQWLALIDTYGQEADSNGYARLKGAAKVASTSADSGATGWYVTALAVFWG